MLVKKRQRRLPLNWQTPVITKGTRVPLSKVELAIYNALSMKMQSKLNRRVTFASQVSMKVAEDTGFGWSAQKLRSLSLKGLITMEGKGVCLVMAAEVYEHKDAKVWTVRRGRVFTPGVFLSGKPYESKPAVLPPRPQAAARLASNTVETAQKTKMDTHVESPEPAVLELLMTDFSPRSAEDSPYEILSQMIAFAESNIEAHRRAVEVVLQRYEQAVAPLREEQARIQQQLDSVHQSAALMVDKLLKQPWMGSATGQPEALERAKPGPPARVNRDWVGIQRNLLALITECWANRQLMDKAELAAKLKVPVSVIATAARKLKDDKRLPEFYIKMQRLLQQRGKRKTAYTKRELSEVFG